MTETVAPTRTSHDRGPEKATPKQAVPNGVPAAPIAALPLPGLVIRRAMSDDDVQRVEAKLAAGANALLTKDDRHYKITARTPDGQNFTLMEVDPTTDDNQEIGAAAVQVTLASLRADYSLDSMVTGGINHPANSANVTKPLVDASLMEHEVTPVSMTHHTFDLVKPPTAPKGKPQATDNQADNHHLTIDNALPAMLATPDDERSKFFADKQKNTKKEFNESLNAHNFHSIDNLHFVPPTDQQGATRLPARHADLKNDKRARPNPRDTTAVEKDVTLQTFRAYLVRAFAGIGLDDGLAQEILAALDRTQGQLGVTAADLHLAAEQRSDFTRLVLLVHKQSGGLDVAHKVPPELEGIIEPQARITLKKAYFGKTQEEARKNLAEYKKDLKPETFQRIQDDLKDEGKKTGKTCTLLEGTDSSVFNDVLAFLVNRHWNLIKGWTLAPPAQPMAVQAQPVQPVAANVGQ